MLDLRRCTLTAGLMIAVATMGMGCGSSDNATPTDGGGTDMGLADVQADVEPDMFVESNIGAYCDPANSDAQGNNPACTGDAQCFAQFDTPPTVGMCVVYGCKVDLSSANINEENCHVKYGSNFTCIDITGPDDTAEPYNPPTSPNGQNANLDDNVCVPKCTPSSTSNPCPDSHFSCPANSRSFNFKDNVCFSLVCQSGADCPVSTTDDRFCAADTDCNMGAGEFCNLQHDTNGDGTADIGACSVAGVCNTTSGTCGPHTQGSATAQVGDPCTSDVDCPVGGSCLNEDNVTINGDPSTHRAPRNGYCTMLGCLFSSATGITCPAGSACDNFFFAGGCMRLCDPADATTCRNNACDVAGGVTTGCDWYGDYDCFNWGNIVFTINNLHVVGGSNGQICDYLGPAEFSCYDNRNLGCALFAPDASNPEDMQCRTALTGVQLPTDTELTGRCLDLTGAGPFCADYGSFDTNGNCNP
jgi:hypothetical protein